MGSKLHYPRDGLAVSSALSCQRSLASSNVSITSNATTANAEKAEPLRVVELDIQDRGAFRI
jgi:hypothetical protein